MSIVVKVFNTSTVHLHTLQEHCYNRISFTINFSVCIFLQISFYCHFAVNTICLDFWLLSIVYKYIKKHCFNGIIFIKTSLQTYWVFCFYIFFIEIFLLSLCRNTIDSWLLSVVYIYINRKTLTYIHVHVKQIP